MKELINNVVNKIALFIQQHPQIKPDFEEYLKTVSRSMKPQAAYFNYIFERRLNGQSMSQVFLQTEKLTKEEEQIAKSVDEAISSVFEIKKIGKNGFILYNIINEKLYDVSSLVKMTAFRGLGIGQYVVARILEYKKQYYLLEISGVLTSTRRDDALRFAVAKIVDNPELVYIDNPQKLKEIEKDIKKVYEKFTTFFGTDEVITTNKYADNLIGIFNDYAEGGKKKEFSKYIKEPKEYKFFAVSEFNNSYDNFLENSLGGFSSHVEDYDVGVMFDEELGMYAIPFYGTFNKIFEVKDYKTILNYDKCIMFFLNNEKFSANIIKKVANKHKKKFMKIVNEVLGTNYTLDELLEKYKSRYLQKKIVSSTTVLYRSKAFSNTLGIIEEEENKPHLELDHKVGRNELCPCGSGKKYKNCCGK